MRYRFLRFPGGKTKAVTYSYDDGCQEEIQKHIVDAGFEIAIHGHVHSAPGKCRAIDGIQEFLNCRLELEKEFGFIVRGMAYPDSGITQMMNQARNNCCKNVSCMIS